MTTYADVGGEQSLQPDELEVIRLRNEVRALRQDRDQVAAAADRLEAKVQALREFIERAVDGLAQGSTGPMPWVPVEKFETFRENARQALGEPVKSVAPAGGFVGKCPRCTRVPRIEIPAGEVIGHCAQCWLGEGVHVPFVAIEGTPA